MRIFAYTKSCKNRAKCILVINVGQFRKYSKIVNAIYRVFSNLLNK